LTFRRGLLERRILFLKQNGLSEEGLFERGVERGA